MCTAMAAAAFATDACGAHTTFWVEGGGGVARSTMSEGGTHDGAGGGSAARGPAISTGGTSEARPGEGAWTHGRSVPCPWGLVLPPAALLLCCDLRESDVWCDGPQVLHAKRPDITRLNLISLRMQKSRAAALADFVQVMSSTAINAFVLRQWGLFVETVLEDEDSARHIYAEARLLNDTDAGKREFAHTQVPPPRSRAQWGQ